MNADSASRGWQGGASTGLPRQLAITWLAIVKQGGRTAASREKSREKTALPLVSRPARINRLGSLFIRNDGREIRSGEVGLIMTMLVILRK
jgi:hypothetical protein